MREISGGQLGTAEVSTFQIGMREISATEISITKVGVSQIGVIEVNATKVNTTEINTTEINSCFLVSFSPGIPCLRSLLENGALLLICHGVSFLFTLSHYKVYGEEIDVDFKTGEQTHRTPGN
jgi:hypothetical protein